MQDGSNSTKLLFNIRQKQLLLLTALLGAGTSRSDGRVVKALDLSFDGQTSAWIRTPTAVAHFDLKSTTKVK